MFGDLGVIDRGCCGDGSSKVIGPLLCEHDTAVVEDAAEIILGLAANEGAVAAMPKKVSVETTRVFDVSLRWLGLGNRMSRDGSVISSASLSYG